MQEQPGPALISLTNLDQPGSPNTDAGISSFAAQRADNNPDDDADENLTATGLNPDPDYEKSANAAELMTPDNAPGPDDNELVSEDTDDDR